MAQIKGILFDLDGTTIDSHTIGMKIVCQIAAERNLPLNEEARQRLIKRWGASHTQLINEVWPQIDADEFFAEWEQRDSRVTLESYPGVHLLLTILGLRGVRLAAITNRTRRSAEHLLRSSGMENYFEIIRCYDDGKPKPHPEGVKIILERWAEYGISREEVVFVGDTVQTDLECARAAKVQFYAVSMSPFFRRHEFDAAGFPGERIMDSFFDLMPYLLDSDKTC